MTSEYKERKINIMREKKKTPPSEPLLWDIRKEETGSFWMISNFNDQ